MPCVRSTSSPATAIGPWRSCERPGCRSLSDLAGKIALVTGGSGGIGAAICRRLAEEGAAVGVGYGSGEDAAERVAEQITSSGGVARVFGADLAEPAAPAQLVSDVEGTLGRADIVVANHGTATWLGMTRWT